MNHKKRLNLLILAALVGFTFTTTPFVLQSNAGTYSLKIQSAEAATQKKKATKKKSTAKKKKVKTNKKATAKPAVPQTENPKWAAMVVDASDGSIVYEKNAEAIRHPASLTKMMTLYLLFDALEGRRYTINSLLDVSAKAAAQPQTNISLQAGDRIPVQTAINALVIRSANDVAMVVAENIGGSQEGFARMMNRKARELGMSKTQFYNPSGLPDNRQVTTAADMARLGIALKRDFPEYYHNFKRTSFNYNGKTYQTHNRVVGRYPGADGIKTGYIRASGFNLVTSVTRGNTRLVGVVLGGYSSSSRDQEMMNMLDRAIFAGAGKGKQPVSQKKTPSQQSQPTQQSQTDETESPGFEEIAEEPPIPAMHTPRTIPAFVPPTPPSAPVAPNFISEQNWAIQVGAFPTLEQAERAARSARNLAPQQLNNGQVQISQVEKDNVIFNRARLIHLTADQARDACQRLSDNKKQCMVIRME